MKSFPTGSCKEEVFEPSLLQATELLIVGRMGALYEAVILCFPLPDMEMSEGTGSFPLESIVLLVVSLHASGLMASVFGSPISLR